MTAISRVFARKRTPVSTVKPMSPDEHPWPRQADQLARQRKINELGEEILLIRVLSGAQPETEGGRQKEARLALLLARAMVDEQGKAEHTSGGES